MNNKTEKAFEPQADEKPTAEELLKEAVKILDSIAPSAIGMFNKAAIHKLKEKIKEAEL